MTSLTQIAIAEFRKNGWMCAVVEHWNGFAKVRQDLFGAFDVLAVHPDSKRTMGLQITSPINVYARKKKLQSLEAMKTWYKAGNEICVVGVKKGNKTTPHEIKLNRIPFGVGKKVGGKISYGGKS